MSAILAIWNRDGRPVDPAIVDAMLAASSHRAVDGQNVYIDGCVALAHQHFWLTPEEQGEVQPIVDNESGLVITCDARLDDRDTLQNKLAVDKSRKLSDAQLVLRAFKRWGEDCVDYLLGDFAFAIWQPKDQKFFIARDPLGVRDLCYFEKDSLFVVTSEIRAVLAHPEVERRINETKIADYLVNRWDEQENSFYEDIYYWPPAHSAVISEQARKMRKYWGLNTARRIRYADEQVYAEEYRELLEACVRDRVRVCGDIVISLSGGTDSTALAALTARNSKEHTPVCLSYVFEDYPECDERQYIGLVTSRLGLPSELVKADALWPMRDLDTWPVFEDFAGQDPFVRLPMAIMDTAAARGCRVIFNGHYSDVLMAGGNYWAVDMLSEGHVLNFGRCFSASRNKKREIRRLLRHSIGAAIPPWIRVRKRRTEIQSRGGGLELLGRGLVERSQLLERIDEPESATIGSRVTSQRKRQLFSSIEPQGKAASRWLSNSKHVEYLDPFWDRRLIEFVMSVPAYVVGRPPYKKHLLRVAIAGLLPEEVVWRHEKTSLFSFFWTGLVEREKHTVTDLLTNTCVVARDFVSASWVKRQRELVAGQGGRNQDRYALWQVLCMELWLRRYHRAG